jgi:hypothetical protein
MAPERLSPLAPNRSDKGLILPAALRAPKGITKTLWCMRLRHSMQHGRFSLPTLPVSA